MSLSSLLSSSADVLVTVGADTSSYDTALKNTQTSSEKWASAVKKSVAVAGVAFAAAAVSVSASAVNMASSATEIQSKFDVVFGQFSDDANAWADDFAATVGRARTEVKQEMAQFQDTFVPLGFARDEAMGLSEELVQLTVDIASFNNAADSDVLADLQSALVGNHETMRKYGVIITQTTLDMELMKMGIEGGISAATEQEKVLARLNIIYAGTSDAQGDAIRTADSYANQLKALNGEVQDLMESIGYSLIPVLQDLFPLFKDGLEDITAWGDAGGFDAITAGAYGLSDALRILVNDVSVFINWGQALFDTCMMIHSAMWGDIDAAKEWHDALVKNLDAVEDSIYGVGDATGDLVGHAGDLYDAMSETGDKVGETSDSVSNLDSTISAAFGSIEMLNQLAGTASATMDDVESSTSEATKSVSVFDSIIGSTNSSLETAIEAMGGFGGMAAYSANNVSTLANTSLGAAVGLDNLSMAGYQAKVAMLATGDAAETATSQVNSLISAYGLAEKASDSYTANELANMQRMYDAAMAQYNLPSGSTMSDAMHYAELEQNQEAEDEAKEAARQAAVLKAKVASLTGENGITLDNFDEWVSETLHAAGGYTAAERAELLQEYRDAHGGSRSGFKLGNINNVLGEDWYFYSNSAQNASKDDEELIENVKALLDQQAALTASTATTNTISVSIGTITEADTYDSVVDAVTQAVMAAVSANNLG